MKKLLSILLTAALLAGCMTALAETEAATATSPSTCSGIRCVKSR